jgi:pimeloyl-ACP methyl ester carboxylesterase
VPGWPDDSSTVADTRRNATSVAGYGINDVVDHYAKAISGLSTKPIAIGHSFGGLVVQRLLGRISPQLQSRSTRRRSRECSTCRRRL